MRNGSFLLLFLLSSSLWAADPVVRQALVTSENRLGKTWTTLSGHVELTTSLSVDELFAVISDWPAYPRLFSRIKEIGFLREGDDVLLSEKVVVSAFGIEVTNRFTLRLGFVKDAKGGVFVPWTQERTDGTIDKLEGSWSLEPTVVAGKPMTLVRYRTLSSVPQTLPGQAGLVGMFYPNELKQMILAVVKEAERRKENS